MAAVAGIDRNALIRSILERAVEGRRMTPPTDTMTPAEMAAWTRAAQSGRLADVLPTKGDPAAAARYRAWLQAAAAREERRP